MGGYKARNMNQETLLPSVQHKTGPQAISSGDGPGRPPGSMGSMNRRPRFSQGTLSSCPVQEGRWGPCGLPTSIVPNSTLSLLGHHLSPAPEASRTGEGKFSAFVTEPALGPHAGLPPLQGLVQQTMFNPVKLELKAWKTEVSL